MLDLEASSIAMGRCSELATDIVDTRLMYVSANCRFYSAGGMTLRSGPPANVNVVNRRAEPNLFENRRAAAAVACRVHA